MQEHAEMIANLSPNVALIAGVDAGYGGPYMVARTVQHYARSGIAGRHIEELIQTKRCSHLSGNEVVDIETFSSRIREMYRR